MLGDKWQVRNFGVSGATMLKKGDKPYDKQKAYTEALAWKPDVVVIKLGTNDSKPQNWKHKQDFAADARALAVAFREVNPAARVFLCLPVPAYPGNFGIRDEVIKGEAVPVLRRGGEGDERDGRGPVRGAEREAGDVPGQGAPERGGGDGDREDGVRGADGEGARRCAQVSGWAGRGCPTRPFRPPLKGLPPKEQRGRVEPARFPRHGFCRADEGQRLPSRAPPSPRCALFFSTWARHRASSDSAGA